MPVLCPRCGQHTVTYERKGCFVAFCMRDFAFLLPQEFSESDLRRLIEEEGVEPA
jgi:hypothetical protein